MKVEKRGILLGRSVFTFLFAVVGVGVGVFVGGGVDGEDPIFVGVIDFVNL